MSTVRDVLVEAATYRDHALVAKLVTARKPHRCDYSRDSSWFRACRDIRPGDQYVRITTFPGHDFIEVTTPVTGACCLPCAEGYEFSNLAEVAYLALDSSGKVS